MNYNLIVFTFTLGQQLEMWFLVACLTPGIHLAMAACVESFMFGQIELPIARVCFSVGASLSWENLLETWVCWWWTLGFCSGLHFLRTVILPGGGGDGRALCVTSRAMWMCWTCSFGAHIITDMYAAVRPFKTKMCLWENQMLQGNLGHFLCCQSMKTQISTTVFPCAQFAEKLIVLGAEFTRWFADFVAQKCRIELSQ